MKVLSNAISRRLFLFGAATTIATGLVFSSIILGTESFTPIKYSIGNRINNTNQFSTVTVSTTHKASTIMKASAQQEEAKRICPFLPSPEDPNTTFEGAMGWFWGPQRSFDREEGIVGTVVGYSGSVSRSEENPTYRSIKDYAESIRITYNADKLNYEDLLEMFFDLHTPSDPRYGGTQYRSAIFVYTPEQKSLAEAACKARGATGAYVTVEEASDFYRGEEYHQKYIEKATSGAYGGR